MALESALVPTRRLGTLLRTARENAGLDLDDLTAVSGLSLVELDDIELGRRALDEKLLALLLRTYGIENAGLLPERSQLVIDLDEGRVAVSDTDVIVDAVHGPDAVLARYLGLVYRLRALPLGTPLPLRDLDIEVLSTALGLAAGDVDCRLRRLMEERSGIREDQHRIRRHLAIPLVGVIVAATGIGTLVLLAEPDPAPDPAQGAVATDPGSTQTETPVAQRPPEVATDLGNGAAIEENRGP